MKPQPTPHTVNQFEKQTARKLPPHDIMAEQSVLGAIFCDNTHDEQGRETHAWFWKACDILSDGAQEFYRPSHQTIFTAMRTLIEQGQAVDLLTVRALLEQQRKCDEVGGPAYLVALVDTVPTAANIESHARIVHDKYRKRRGYEAGLHIAYQGLDDSTSADEYLQTSAQLLGEVIKDDSADWMGLNSLAHPMFEELEDLAARKQAITGVPTGFLDFDEMTTGLQPGEVCILSGRTSTGKTALALCAAHHVAKVEHLPVAIFSLEMSEQQLYKRLLSIETGIPLQTLRTGKGLTPEDWDRIQVGTEVLAKLPIDINASKIITPLGLIAKANAIVNKRGTALIVVDHVGLVHVPQKSQSRAQDVSEISRMIKVMAMDLRVPVIAVAQPNREHNKREDKRPQLFDLKDSGSLEQDADIVAFLYRPELHGDNATMDGTTELIVAKQRNGPLGTVWLQYQRDCTKFVNSAKPASAIIAPPFENPFSTDD